MLCRFLEHICGFPRSVKSVGARDLEVGDAIEGKGLDGIRIGAVCAERTQNRVYQSSGKGRRCVVQGKKLDQRRSLLQGLLIEWAGLAFVRECVRECVCACVCMCE